MTGLVLQRWWLLGLRGVLACVFGVLAILWPGATLAVLAALFAAFALVGAAVWIFSAVTNRHDDKRWWLMLLLGIAGMAAAAVAIAHPALTITVMIVVVGAHALVSGTLELAVAIGLRRHVKGEWRLALAGLASLLFGLVVLLFPTGAGAIALSLLIGCYAITSGVLMMALALRLRGVGRSRQDRGTAGAAG